VAAAPSLLDWIGQGDERLENGQGSTFCSSSPSNNLI